MLLTSLEVSPFDTSGLIRYAHIPIESEIHGENGARCATMLSKEKRNAGSGESEFASI